MTEPFDLRAANALVVENILTTPEDRLVPTLSLSPPYWLLPHVTTEPSFLRAANAKLVEITLATSDESF